MLDRLIKLPLYFPDEAPPTPNGEGLSVLDIAEELNKDDDDDSNKDDELDEENKEEKKESKFKSKGKEEDKDEDEDEEEDEDESESEDEDEDEDDEIEYVLKPLNRAQVLKDFPDLFKKYPQLEKSYYAARDYRQVFPTLSDAKEAQNRLEEYGQIDKELNQGSPAGLFKTLKESNPDAFGQMVDNYLPELAKVDNDAYFHVIETVIKSTVARMGKLSSEKKDDDLMTAARILNEFAFGTEEFTPPQRFGKAQTKEKSDLEKEREAFQNEKLETNQREVQERVSATIKATVEQHIDPKGRMSSYVKRTAINEAVDNVNELLHKDKELKKLSEKMWKTAQTNKFSPEYVGKIRRAYQERAKVILPQVIRKVRGEALQGVAPSRRSDKDRNGHVASGQGNKSASRSDNSGNNKSGEKSKIPAGMSSLDFLNAD